MIYPYLTDCCTNVKFSLSNSNYFTSAKMEFASAIFKKLYFSKYSVKRCCKQITSIQKLVIQKLRFLMG